MKEKLAKISVVCKKIFGYGILATFFAGGLTFLFYLVAFFVGGETAADICNLVYKDILPIIIYASTVLVLVGLLAMYLAGEKALTPDKPNKNKN